MSWIARLVGTIIEFDNECDDLYSVPHENCLAKMLKLPPLYVQLYCSILISERVGGYGPGQK